jgi:hypothetical protein
MQEEPTNETDVSPLYSEFAYDDAFRTMETECDDIVIPFVNYFYNENYDKAAVITRMDKELQAGNLSVYSYDVIIRLTHKVLYKLTIKHKTVQEKVGGVMGGKVLDLPEVRLYHQGVEEGRKEGEAERNKLQSENDALRKELEVLKAMRK